MWIEHHSTSGILYPQIQLKTGGVQEASDPTSTGSTLKSFQRSELLSLSYSEPSTSTQEAHFRTFYW